MNALSRPLLMPVALAGFWMLTGCQDHAAAPHDEHHHENTHAQEARTHIEPAMARRFQVETALAGPGVIREVYRVFGSVRTNPALTTRVSARFPGIVREVPVAVGAEVAAGALLALVESDESLMAYRIVAPRAGVVTERFVNPGEHTGPGLLFELVDLSSVWVEFAVFPGQRQKLETGQSVSVSSMAGAPLGSGRVEWFALEANADQSVSVRTTLPNPEGALVAGMHVTGEIIAAEYPAEVVVERRALQSLDERNVVFVRSGDAYEARPVALGRQDEMLVEVLEGIDAGERYVTANSYLIKADIEKSGAAHEH